MKKNKIVIIDLGIGNLLSLSRAVKSHQNSVLITNSKEEILAADKIILPGVGTFKKAMSLLSNLKIISAIRDVHNAGKPILGICLGMQLLMEESEESGLTEGLGLIKGRVEHLSKKTKEEKLLKIPHIGWNSLDLPDNKSSNIWKKTILHNIKENSFFYFMHSFSSILKDQEDILAVTNYGGHKISAVFNKKNLSGCQFHPEKSGPIGIKIIKNFLK